MNYKKLLSIMLISILVLSLAACSETTQSEEAVDTTATTDTVASASEEEPLPPGEATTSTVEAEQTVEGSYLDVSEMFTERDLEQSPDLSDARTIVLGSEKDVTISEKGTYVVTGNAKDTMITVDVDEQDVVQIVLDGVSITNESRPAIYVKSADKVLLTTTESDNFLEVTGTFTANGETSLDSVVFSKEDLVLNGLGSISIISAEGNGITSKDDLKVTGGSITIDAYLDGMEANDSIRVFDGDIIVRTSKDALHSENSEDSTKGYIYIKGGTLAIAAADDGIRANTVVQIDGGEINIETCMEGIEGTYVQLNGGTININSKDDGINAANKSDLDVTIQVNGGNINVVMASGDTDGFDANGNLFINGGTISVEGQSAFDADGAAQLLGGTVTVNGEKITEITVQHFGGKPKRF